MASNEIEVIGGPPKFDLSIALFNRKKGQRSPLVTFKLGMGTEVKAKINAVKAYDNGETWEIEGTLIKANQGSQKFPCNFSAWWNTKRHYGNMYFNNGDVDWHNFLK